MDEELFQRMQEAAARFKSGESDFEEIMTPVGPAHLVRDANDPRGFRIDFVGASAKHTVPVQRYPASPGRPPGYPAPLPFLAGCASTVDTLDQSVTWINPPGGEAAFERVLAEMTDDGWEPIDSDAEADAEGLRRVLEKEDAERTLTYSAEGETTRLVLVERQAAPTDA